MNWDGPSDSFKSYVEAQRAADEIVASHGIPRRPKLTAPELSKKGKLMPTGSEGSKGRMKEAVGKLTDDPELEMEGEVQRKRDDAELKTRGWTQPKAWSPAAQEAEEAEREAERRAEEQHRRS